MSFLRMATKGCVVFATILALCTQFKVLNGFEILKVHVNSAVESSLPFKTKMYGEKQSIKAETLERDAATQVFGGAGARVFFATHTIEDKKLGEQILESSPIPETPISETKLKIMSEVEIADAVLMAPKFVTRPQYFAERINYPPQPQSKQILEVTPISETQTTTTSEAEQETITNIDEISTGAEDDSIGSVLKSYLEMVTFSTVKRLPVNIRGISGLKDVPKAELNKDENSVETKIKQGVEGSQLEQALIYGRPFIQRPVYYRTLPFQSKKFSTQVELATEELNLSTEELALSESQSDVAKEKSLGELASDVASSAIEIAKILSLLFYNQKPKETKTSEPDEAIQEPTSIAAIETKTIPKDEAIQEPTSIAAIETSTIPKVELADAVVNAPKFLQRPQLFPERINYPPQSKAEAARELGPAPGTPVRPKYFVPRVNHPPQAKKEAPRELGPAPGTPVRAKYFAPRINFPPQPKATYIEPAEFISRPQYFARRTKAPEAELIESSSLQPSIVATAIKRRDLELEKKLLAILNTNGSERPRELSSEQTDAVIGLCSALISCENEINSSLLCGRWRMIFDDESTKRLVMKEQMIDCAKGTMEESVIYKVGKRPAIEIPIYREATYSFEKNHEFEYTGYGPHRGSSEDHELLYLSETLRINIDSLSRKHIVFQRIMS